MTETEDQSPFGRGFIAATIVVVAILACGVLLLFTGPTSAPATPSIVTQPVPARTANRCNLPAGDQSIPSARPPATDQWQVSRRVVVPHSSTHGPAITDPDGFRHCFAHSPTGAIYAAYNVLAALADQTQALLTARKLMLPGPDTDALLEQLKSEPSTASPTQLAGYRVLDASRDRATIMLAVPVESEYMSVTITLTWYADDWRLVPPVGNNPVGAPYSQHRDLDGFVAWSGV